MEAAVAEGSKRPPVPCSGWCYSEAEADTVYKYAWTIERFSRTAASYKPGKTMYSDQFMVMVHGRETRWRLKMYPNGRKPVDAGYVTLFLKDSGRFSPANVRAHVEFSVVNGLGEHTNKKVIDKEYKVLNHAFGYSKFVKHTVLQTPDRGLLAEDRLTLLCTITIPGKCIVSSGREAAPPPSLPIPQSSTLGAHLGQLLASPEELFSDVVLEVGERVEGRPLVELPCHANILSARSPVFRAMFQHDTAEARSRRVRVPDIEPDVVRQLLLYLYTGALDSGAQGREAELLAAADKYGVLELKAQCETVLCSQIQADTVLSLLVIADRHDAAELKSSCVKVVVERSQEVVRLPNWREILQPYPGLLADVFEQLASSPLAKRRRID